MGQKLIDLEAKTTTLTNEVTALKSRTQVDAYTKTETDSKLVTAASAAILDTVTLQADGKMRIKYKSGIEQTVPIPEVVGAPVSAQLAVFVPYVLERSEWDYGGNDLKTMSGTVGQCGQTCNDTTGCVGFGRHIDTGTCWLKSAKSIGVSNPKINYYRPPTAQDATNVATATATVTNLSAKAITTTDPFNPPKLS